MPSLTITTAALALIGSLALTTTAAPLEARQFGNDGGGGSSTRNDLTSSAGCKPTILIFARGTTEPGNIGFVVGPPLASALESKLGSGNVAVQGVDYAADWNGALSGGDQAGSATMAQLITQATTQCPTSNIVIGGYSQGAQLVHNAANSLPADVAGKISSAVVFGDPYNPQAVRNVPNLLSVCFTDDDICAGRGGSASGTGGHTAYGKETGAAADFIAQHLSSLTGGGGADAAVSVPSSAAPTATPTSVVVPSAAAPTVVPSATPVTTAMPAPGAGTGPGSGSGNGSLPSFQDIIDGFLATWGKAKGKGN